MTEAELTLSEVDGLRRRVQAKAHSGAWLPAAAIATLILASIVLYQDPFTRPIGITAEYPSWAGLPDTERSALASYLYWFLATPLVFGGISYWYRWRTNHVGLRVAWQFPVIVGVAVLVKLLFLASLPVDLIDVDSPRWEGLISPLVPMTLAVLAFAWAERSPGLALAGLWLGGLVLWECTTFPLGTFLAGQLTLGFDRPGTVLIIMVLPLVVYAVVGFRRDAALSGPGRTR